MANSDMVNTIFNALWRAWDRLGDQTSWIPFVADVPIPAAVVDVNVPAANTAAVVTKVAVAATSHVITGVAWSYSAAPTNGRLTITDAGNTVFDIDITAAGWGSITFPVPKVSAAVNTAMVVTLAAGGAGISGKVNILNYWAT